MRSATSHLLTAVVLISTFFCLTSCLKSENDFTPYVTASYPVRNHTDTLHYTIDEGTYVFDTIAVGDTVNYWIACGSYANNLVSLNAKWDENSLKHEAIVNDTIMSVLTEETDIDHFKLMFEEGYNGVVFPVRVVSLRSGASTITYTVTSDSKYATADLKFAFYTK